MVGILNGLDLVEFDRKALLTHVHAGTLGWITLGFFAAEPRQSYERRRTMTTVAYTGFVIAGLWVVSLITLAVEFTGSRLFGYISTVSSLAAGIGMLVLAVSVSRAAFAPESATRTFGLILGLAGSAAFSVSTLLVLIGFRSFMELVGWIMAGAAVFGLWLIWLNIDAPEAFQLTAALRWFGVAVGIGFILLFISILAIGPLDPTQGGITTGLMAILQTVGGGLAYIGFPAWLFLFARRLL